MSEAPITLDEIARCLESSARAEMLAIDIMECSAARTGAPVGFSTEVKAIRRRGAALGMARQIALALKANPGMALGLGIAGLAELEGHPSPAAPAETAP